MMDLINYEHFSKVKLKVGQIISAEDIINKDKLFLLKVDVGENEPRTLFAGIKKFYTKEELQNKKVIVVSNLEPKKISSLESNGMLLAASSMDDAGEEKVALLEPDKDMPNGSDIY